MKHKDYQKSIEQDAANVKQNLSSLFGNSVHVIETKVGEFTNGAKEKLSKTSAAVKHDVGRGLNQYNAKAQAYMEKIPGGVAEKAAKYPWVAISIGLGVGVLLGSLLKPSRRW